MNPTAVFFEDTSRAKADQSQDLEHQSDEVPLSSFRPPLQSMVDPKWTHIELKRARQAIRQHSPLVSGMLGDSRKRDEWQGPSVELPNPAAQETHIDTPQSCIARVTRTLTSQRKRLVESLPSRRNSRIEQMSSQLNSRLGALEAQEAMHKRTLPQFWVDDAQVRVAKHVYSTTRHLTGQGPPPLVLCVSPMQRSSLQHPLASRIAHCREFLRTAVPCIELGEDGLSFVHHNTLCVAEKNTEMDVSRSVVDQFVQPLCRNAACTCTHRNSPGHIVLQLEFFLSPLRSLMVSFPPFESFVAQIERQVVTALQQLPDGSVSIRVVTHQLRRIFCECVRKFMLNDWCFVHLAKLTPEQLEDKLPTTSNSSPLLRNDASAKLFSRETVRSALQWVEVQRLFEELLSGAKKIDEEKMQELLLDALARHASLQGTWEVAAVFASRMIPNAVQWVVAKGLQLFPPSDLLWRLHLNWISAKNDDCSVFESEVHKAIASLSNAAFREASALDQDGATKSVQHFSTQIALLAAGAAVEIAERRNYGAAFDFLKNYVVAGALPVSFLSQYNLCTLHIALYLLSTGDLSISLSSLRGIVLHIHDAPISFSWDPTTLFAAGQNAVSDDAQRELTKMHGRLAAWLQAACEAHESLVNGSVDIIACFVHSTVCLKAYCSCSNLAPGSRAFTATLLLEHTRGWLEIFPTSAAPHLWLDLCELCIHQESKSIPQLVDTVINCPEFDAIANELYALLKSHMKLNLANSVLQKIQSSLQSPAIEGPEELLRNKRQKADALKKHIDKLLIVFDAEEREKDVLSEASVSMLSRAISILPTSTQFILLKTYVTPQHISIQRDSRPFTLLPPTTHPPTTQLLMSALLLVFLPTVKGC